MSQIKPQKTAVIVLAAGLGKRMYSSLPKVLVPVCGRPMIFFILDQVQQALPGARVAVVVGHQKNLVIEQITAQKYSHLNIDFIEQAEQKGTGHAVKCVMESGWGKDTVAQKENILVLPGDLPLLTQELIQDISQPLQRGSALRLLTAIMPDPFGYGRIVRKGKKGPVIRIVEEKDSTLREKLISEVGLSIYLFQSGFLNAGVQDLKNTNAQKEYYLTDLISMASKKKRTIETFAWARYEDVRGINNAYELSLVCETLNERIVKGHALNGVRFMNLRSVRVEPSVKIASDVSVYPGVVLEGDTEIASGVMIGPHVFLKNVKVGKGTEIKKGTIAENSIIGENAKVGPYAHLRPESVVGNYSKVGNFVELKKTSLGEHTNVSHLSYLGDAEVGSNVNVGCGFITCNYDGYTKHKTKIEDHVFIGSDCQVVAPLTLKRGSYIAAGSTLTEDAPEDSLAIARSRQVNKAGYGKSLRDSKKSKT